MRKVIAFVILITCVGALVSCGTNSTNNHSSDTFIPSETSSIAKTAIPKSEDVDSLLLKENDSVGSNIEATEDTITLDINQSYILKIAITSNSIAFNDLLWQSSNTSIVNVNQHGKVTALKEGSCSITVSAEEDPASIAVFKIMVNGGTKKQTTVTSKPTNTKQPVKTVTPKKTKAPSKTKTPSKTSTPVVTKSPTPTDSAVDNEVFFHLKYAEEVLALLNEERVKEGLSELKMNDKAVEAAEIRATEIVSKFNHTRPNGTDALTSLEECQVTYTVAGENIAAGQGNPEAVMDNWMSSSGHQANILNSDFSEIGIACFVDPNNSYKYYWVQLFIG